MYCKILILQIKKKNGGPKRLDSLLKFIRFLSGKTWFGIHQRFMFYFALLFAQIIYFILIICVLLFLEYTKFILQNKYGEPGAEPGVVGLNETVLKKEKCNCHLNTSLGPLPGPHKEPDQGGALNFSFISSQKIPSQ